MSAIDSISNMPNDRFMMLLDVGILIVGVLAIFSGSAVYAITGDVANAGIILAAGLGLLAYGKNGLDTYNTNQKLKVACIKPDGVAVAVPVGGICPYAVNNVVIK